jgi:hypothetical protein
MIALLILPAMISHCLEPDGSRTLGIVPPYHAEPAPPQWLRATSHALAVSCGGSTRHYVYEAYADGGGEWLVRYIHYPEGDEVTAEAQQAFVFSSDPLGEPRNLEPEEIRFERGNACWEGTAFILVDRRDLKIPTGRSPSQRRP